MQLVYYRKKVPNFGDDLNPLLWPALAPDLFAPDAAEGFVGVGTIIGMDVGAARKLHVFSSGVGYDPPDRWKGLDVRYRCVRGPISARALGLDAEVAISDGAILAPLVPAFPAAASGAGGTVVMPHWETLEFPGWDQVAAATGFTLLDPRQDPRTAIAGLAAAKLVLTESLHGAILADIYGVPWRAFATSRNFDLSKWADWSLSVGRPAEVTMVPPPDVAAVLRFGRCAAPYGTTLRYGAEEAMAAFGSRMAYRPGLVARAKQLLKESALARPLYRLSPARTAEALAALARTEGVVTAPAVRQALQARMLDRLRALLREHCGAGAELRGV